MPRYKLCIGHKSVCAQGRRPSVGLGSMQTELLQPRDAENIALNPDWLLMGCLVQTWTSSLVRKSSDERKNISVLIANSVLLVTDSENSPKSASCVRHRTVPVLLPETA